MNEALLSRVSWTIEDICCIYSQNGFTSMETILVSSARKQRFECILQPVETFDKVSKILGIPPSKNTLINTKPTRGSMKRSWWDPSKMPEPLVRFFLMDDSFHWLLEQISVVSKMSSFSMEIMQRIPNAEDRQYRIDCPRGSLVILKLGNPP